jgi:hypothetical protein
MQPPPPIAWNQPHAGAPPGAPVRSPAARYATLGTTALVLAVIQLLFDAQRMVSALFGGSFVSAERGLFPARAGMPSFDKMFDAAQAFAARIALWEAVRAIPFVLASSALVWIGVRLRRGDGAALATARRWVAGAFVVLIASVLVQAFVTIPATIEYSKTIFESFPAMPTGKAAMPFDIKEMTSQMTVVLAILGAFASTTILAVWPIVLFVWAGKLQRETLAPSAPAR